MKMQMASKTSDLEHLVRVLAQKLGPPDDTFLHQFMLA